MFEGCLPQGALASTPCRGMAPGHAPENPREGVGRHPRRPPRAAPPHQPRDGRPREPFGRPAVRSRRGRATITLIEPRAAWAAASSDLDRLIGLKLGEPDTLGAPIDQSESGPLGPLWPRGMPEWYTEAATGTVTPHEEPAGDAG